MPRMSDDGGDLDAPSDDRRALDLELRARYNTIRTQNERARQAQWRGLMNSAARKYGFTSVGVVGPSDVPGAPDPRTLRGRTGIEPPMSMEPPDGANAILTGITDAMLGEPVERGLPRPDFLGDTTGGYDEGTALTQDQLAWRQQRDRMLAAQQQTVNNLREQALSGRQMAGVQQMLSSRSAWEVMAASIEKQLIESLPTGGMWRGIELARNTNGDAFTRLADGELAYTWTWKIGGQLIASSGVLTMSPSMLSWDNKQDFYRELTYRMRESLLGLVNAVQAKLRDVGASVAPSAPRDPKTVVITGERGFDFNKED